MTTQIAAVKACKKTSIFSSMVLPIDFTLVFTCETCCNQQKIDQTDPWELNDMKHVARK
jgi:hypothetical protein